MRLRLALFFGATMALGGVAQAQTTAGANRPESKVYVEGVAQSAFGNQTSQSYGAEAGVRISPDVYVFVEGGRARNIAASTLGTNAQAIADSLTRVQTSPVTFTAREPAAFATAGLKYLVQLSGKPAPYVMAGFGIARVTSDVHFLIAGSEITSNMAQYGVVLGRDLSGSSTKPMLTFGGGVIVPVWRRVVVDFQYRFGRIFITDQSVNINRAGAGIGFRF
jgi:opacity protein-like surface antigen